MDNVFVLVDLASTRDAMDVKFYSQTGAEDEARIQLGKDWHKYAEVRPVPDFDVHDIIGKARSLNSCGIRLSEDEAAEFSLSV